MTSSAAGKASALFFIVLLPVLLRAQPDTSGQDPFLLGARLHYGFIIPHSKDIAGVSGTHPFGLELNVQWLLTREKYTRASGVIAKRGFLLQYFDYDNKQVLGHCLSAAAYVEPLIRPDRRVYAAVQMGLGISYLSKVYDRNTNPKNLFFSTHISYLLVTNAYLFAKVNPHWNVSLGFNYNHISNGGMKEPNKGMNFPTWNAGAVYQFRPATIRRVAKTRDWRNLPRFYAYLHGVGSIKKAEATDAFPTNKPKWLLGGIAVAGRRVGRLSALAAGTEWIHDGWAREILDRAGDRTSALKGGILAGHELLSGRVRFTLHLGVYVYNPSRTTDAVYQRYGLFYQIGRHLQFGSTLKAHRHVADVFDLRLGWLW